MIMDNEMYPWKTAKVYIEIKVVAYKSLTAIISHSSQNNSHDIAKPGENVLTPM